MNNEKLGELVELQRGIRHFESLQNDMSKRYWVRIEAADTPIFNLPSDLYANFQKWVDEQLADMKKRFEEG